MVPLLAFQESQHAGCADLSTNLSIFASKDLASEGQKSSGEGASRVSAYLVEYR